MNVSLRELTTLRVGGRPAYTVPVVSERDVFKVIEIAQQHRLPISVIGGGSNILARDGELPIVLMQVQIPGILFTDTGDRTVVEVGAGVAWDEFVAATVERGLWGVENLSGIPGTVGASPIQNIGAYGVEVRSLIVSLDAINLETGVARLFDQNMCLFGYRSSFFKSPAGRKYLVTCVRFLLSKVPQPKIEYKDLAQYGFKNKYPDLMSVREAVLSIRNAKFPDLTSLGTAGSFFKNIEVTREEYGNLGSIFPGVPGYPQQNGRVKVPIAYMLEALDYKGIRRGNVGLYERHALVLINYGNASYEEVDLFAKEIEKEIFHTTRIVIEREVISFP